jgi:hypothetical protein
VALVRALGADSSIRKSEASRICADLDAEIGPFRTLNSTNSHRRGSCSPALAVRKPRWLTTSASAAPTPPETRSRRPPAPSAPTQSSLALPQGYDTEVGERGALLSAGERQLVAFARAWLADPALLLLDEATSNLDVATETRVIEAMRRLRQGRTTIVIAHRLSTVIEADQIAVIEDGRVLEVGPPEELLARGGRFADLYGRWLAGAA